MKLRFLNILSILTSLNFLDVLSCQDIVNFGRARLDRYVHAIIFLFLCFSFSPAVTKAQVTDQHDVVFTIPEIALVDIEPDNTSIVLTLDAPTEAGNPATISASSTNATKWLNYSSSLSPSATNRTITAQITSGTLPGGIALRLRTSTYSGIGQGTLGNPTGNISLNNSPKVLISGIGGAYTGDGENGHLLTFSLRIRDYDLLNYDDSGTVEVMFTITD